MVCTLSKTLLSQGFSCRYNMHTLFWFLCGFVTSPDSAMPPRHRKGRATLASLLLPETCTILTHTHTLCSPVLLVFPLIPLVNMLLHQPVITRLYSHSTLPLKTDRTPMFQSLRRPFPVPHPASSKQAFNMLAAAFYVSNCGRAGTGPGRSYPMMYIPA